MKQNDFDFKISHIHTYIQNVHFPLLSVLNPDNSYEMLIDQSSVSRGSLLHDVVPPVNPTKEIDDPNDSKPEDWDERAKIPDPEAVKPNDW